MTAPADGRRDGIEEPRGDLLTVVAEDFRTDHGVRAKRDLQVVTQVLGGGDWLHGPGDDTAVVPIGVERVLAAGEVIYPPFVAADPAAAGAAAVVTNVNDVAAMGGRPVALVDAITGPRELAVQVLTGMRDTAALYGLPIVGGHLTLSEEQAHVAAFILGRAGTRVLSSTAARPGHILLVAALLEGQLRQDFPFFASVPTRGRRLAGDVAVLADLAAAGDALACKDVSMGGLLGSLAMLLEPSGCGVSVDLAAVPHPAEVTLRRWLGTFPTFAFLLTCAPERAGACRAAFGARGIACERLGELDGSGQLRVALEGREELLADLPAGGFVRPAAHPGAPGPSGAGRARGAWR